MTIKEINKLIHNLELACELAACQQKEIDRLKNELHGKVEYIHEQREIIDEKKAEIERLTEEINALNGNTEKYIAECEKRSREMAEDCRKEIKSEAIREFAKELKKRASKIFIARSGRNERIVDYQFSPGIIDNLVKEMTEGSK